MRKLLSKKLCLCIMIVSWLALIWGRTFVGMSGYDEGITVWTFLLKSFWTVLGTVIYSCIITFWWEDLSCELEDSPNCFEKGQYSSGLRNSLCAVLGLAGICMFSFISEKWSLLGLNLFSDSNYMEIGYLYLNKKYFYDIIMIIVFPLWSAFILKKVRESGFIMSAIISGILQISMLTIMEYLLYMELSNVWLVELALVNIVTLIVEIKLFVWDKAQKGDVVALVMGYILFWGILLSAFCYSGQSITTYMVGQRNWDQTLPYSYISNVKRLLENASFIGQNDVLLGDINLLDFLYKHSNPILSALFHGGWGVALAVVTLEVIFIVSAGALLWKQENKRSLLEVVIYIAWWALTVKAVAGILYTFGVPVPINLPFTDEIGIIADSMAMGLLILNYLVKKVEKYMILDDLEDFDDGDDCEEVEDAEHDDEN